MAAVRFHIDANGRAIGCVVRSNITAYVQKSVLGLYSGPNGSGCLVADGNYKGNVFKGHVIPMAYYYVTNHCFGP